MTSNKIRRVSVTEAARNFADIVNRAYYRGETTVLMRNGTAVAHIAPAAPLGLPAHEVLRRWKMRRPMGRAAADEMARAIAEGRKMLLPPGDPWA